jgi:hypothetical protein
MIRRAAPIKASPRLKAPEEEGASRNNKKRCLVLRLSNTAGLLAVVAAAAGLKRINLTFDWYRAYLRFKTQWAWNRSFNPSTQSQFMQLARYGFAFCAIRRLPVK